MPDAHANFAYSTVATAPSPATSGTSLVVASGDGAKFPATPFNVTIWPAGTQPTTANAEIARVTTRATDTLTITRAQESTSARTVIVGDQIANTATIKAFTDIETDVASNSTQVALQAAQIAAQAAANLGYFAISGLALSPNASALTSVSSTIATSLFNKTAHGLVANDTITFTGLSTTTGVTNGTVYFVSATGLTANAFRVAATAGGTAITLGGTADSSITVTQVGKLDMAAGQAQFNTAATVPAAQTAIATTVASMADATNPKWVAVELDSSSVVNFNQGTAAASPAFPTPTASRVVLGWLWIPANATKVDTLLTTNNGLAKLIDARVFAAGVPIPTTVTFSNADTTIAATTRYQVQTGTMSASHAANLPLASSVPVGTPITLLDSSGTVTAANFLSLNHSGSDLINGAAGAVFILQAYGSITVVSDGVSKWTFPLGVLLPIARGGTSNITAQAAFDALSPMTTRGDLIYEGATSSLRLPKGTPGQVLGIGANDPAWVAAYSPVGTDIAQTILTNPTALTTLLASTFSIPAASVAVGDVFEIEAAGQCLNSQNAATIEFQILFGAKIMFDWTTLSLSTNANNRRWLLRCKVAVGATGASGTVRLSSEGMITPGVTGTSTALVGMSLGGAAAGDWAIHGVNQTAVDFTGALAVDLQTKISVSSSTATVQLRYFRIHKLAA